jgi:hypothetical protein
MAWRVAGVAGLVAVVAVAAAFVALMPKVSGDGWRLDPAPAWEEEGPMPGQLEPTATVYGSDETSVGIGVTAFGSSSCPPELRNVELGDQKLTVTIAGPIAFGGCTADAAPHRFGIVVERERLPEPPFTVVVDHDGMRSTTEIESVP